MLKHCVVITRQRADGQGHGTAHLNEDLVVGFLAHAPTSPMK